MDIKNLRKLLIRHEGMRLKPYRCSAGKLTIGVGRNLESIGITESEAHFLLDNDIARVYWECDRAFPWFKNLNDARQDVVVNMAFNLGLSRLKQFMSMIYHLERLNFPRAAEEMLDSRWAFQVGYRAKELAEMMITGEYPGDGDGAA